MLYDFNRDEELRGGVITEPIGYTDAELEVLDELSDIIDEFYESTTY